MTKAISWVCGILLIVGCSSEDGSSAAAGPYDPNDPGTWTFMELVDKALEDAQEADVDPQQIDALEEARDQGEVTFTQYQEAFLLTQECMDEAGLDVGDIWEYNARGIRILTGTFGVPDGMDPDVGFSLYDACYRQHQDFLTMVYSHQPTSRDAFLEVIGERQVALRQCLVDMGYADAQEMTMSELQFALTEQSLNNGWNGAPEGRDCLLESGISL